MPAPNATDASTIPGPPRAFVANAMYRELVRGSPASRAPAYALVVFTTHANTTNQQKNQG
jgi:hypothetical protein